MSYLGNDRAHQPDCPTATLIKEEANGRAVGTRATTQLKLAADAPAATAGTAALHWPPFDELDLVYDRGERIAWQYMRPQRRPSFTPGLLRDMTAALDLVEGICAAAGSEDAPVDFLVLASRMPGIFNLGGDLPHFIELIERRDFDRLSWYARVCARGQHRRAVNLGLPICTIALVQGDALGGGFEAALAHDVIIAERKACFGLPEILFNLFPGMGAYSFLARKLDPVRAERIILSGKVYTAVELHEMGVVDRLCGPGEGPDAVREYVAEFRRARNTRQAMLRARKILAPVSLQELIDIADLWVEAAMRLRPSDLRRMQHLARAQDRRWAGLAERTCATE